MIPEKNNHTSIINKLLEINMKKKQMIIDLKNKIYHLNRSNKYISKNEEDANSENTRLQNQVNDDKKYYCKLLDEAYEQIHELEQKYTELKLEHQQMRTDTEMKIKCKIEQKSQELTLELWNKHHESNKIMHKTC